MYLHLGGEVVVRTRDILGIFDLETTTTVKSTREYLSECEKRLLITNVTTELPKSFVITTSPEGVRVYITQISCNTLKLRAKQRSL